VPPPLPRRSCPCGQWEPSPADLRFGLRMVPLESGSCGLYLRGSSVRLMLRPADLLRPLARPRATFVPALVHLRQSLPVPRSPSERVCYRYSVPSSLPRRDLHPLVCQRTKAAQSAIRRSNSALRRQWRDSFNRRKIACKESGRGTASWGRPVRVVNAGSEWIVETPDRFRKP
jgi:hypothetical protein